MHENKLIEILTKLTEDPIHSPCGYGDFECGTDNTCFFCGLTKNNRNRGIRMPENHKEDCAWRIAKELLSS